MTGGATIRFVQRSGWGNAMKYLLTGLKFGSHAKQNESYKRFVEENHLFTRAVG